MGTIICTDCQSPISTTAKTCPNCGADIAGNDKKWELRDKIALGSTLVSSVTLLVGVIAAWVAYSQFTSADDWKRREFVAAQIKEFYGDRVNASVLNMLDYNPTTVELHPNEPNPQDRFVSVAFDDLVISIADESSLIDKNKFAIRQQFEHFLRSLARFGYLVRYGAITPKELCSDLGYPLSLLSGDAEVRQIKFDNTGLDIEPLAKAVGDYFERWRETDIPTFIRTMHSACTTTPAS